MLLLYLALHTGCRWFRGNWNDFFQFTNSSVFIVLVGSLLLICSSMFHSVCSWQLDAVMRRHQRSVISSIAPTKAFLLGFFLACLFFMLTRFAIVPCFRSLDHTIPATGGWQLADAGMIRTSTTDENLLLIGVMSTKEFLESRVVPIFDTWARNIPGKVSYFDRCWVIFSFFWPAHFVWVN